MKKTVYYIMAVFLSLSFNPLQLNAATITDTAAASSLVISEFSESAEVTIMQKRINEISAINKSNLKSSDRKSLRKELLSIRDRLLAMNNGGGGGVYISVGALIIIILLLIIIF